jgi:hypothetical protein
MERGFMTDVAGSVINLPRWCPGDPTHSWFTGGVKGSQHERGSVVVAYRCTECFALRLYAFDGQT